MSAMSASPVKPILPPSGVTSSPPKVAPSNTTTASIAPSIPSAACNLPGSPLKNAGMNHNTVSLNLVSDNKPPSVTVPTVQPLPRTPEKPKETVPNAPLSLNNLPLKVTSNGVPSVTTAAPVSAPTAAPVTVPSPISTPAPAPISTTAPLAKEAPTNPVAVPKQESPVKPESALPKPTENHTPGPVVPPPASAATPPAPKVDLALKTPPLVCQLEKKESSPDTKSDTKAEAKSEAKTPEKPAPKPAAAPTVAPVLTSSATSQSSAPATAPASDAGKSAVKTETAPQPETKTAKAPRTPKRKAEPKAADPVQSGDERKSKRARLPTQPYQSPLPELTLITKMATKTTTPTKKEDDKLIVFYKNEFLAVRNAEGGFYVCQSMQNIYRSSSKIRIRWLSQDSSGVYIPDFYDHSDFECILTSLSLSRVDKDKWKLPEDERLRTENILKRALDVEKGVVEKPPVTEEHPDGLDLSLFKDESQLKKSRKSTKKASPKPKPPKTPKKEEEAEPTPKKEPSSKKKKASPVKTKKATPAKTPAKKTPARNAAAAKPPPAKKPAVETKKAAVKRKAPKTASPSTSFSSLTPAEKRRKVIENLTKQVSTNERSTKTRRKI